MVPDQKGEFIQFTAAGHVLGFTKRNYYVANPDHMLHVKFVGATDVAPMGLSIQKTDDENSQLDSVAYFGLWPGINLRYELVDQGIAMSTWEIAPEANVNQIRLRYNSPVSIKADGSIVIQYENGWLYESAPVAWQNIEGKLYNVKITFHLFETTEKESIVGFNVGDYNHAYPLLIDPTLEWNTFMGSAGWDGATAISTDIWGNIYVAGLSTATWGNPISPHTGNYDAFVAKLDANGKLLWNTFLGSSEYDAVRGIAVDIWGNVYLIGESEASWGSPVRPFTVALSIVTYSDAFVAKMDSNGNKLWHTFLGSIDDDYGRAIAVEIWGNRVYVVGTSDATWGSPTDPFIGGRDTFMAGLVGSNGALVGNTFIGSSGGYVEGTGIALDSNLNVYVAGYSDSSWGTPVNQHAGDSDIYVSKFDENGRYLWHTFLGSGDADFAYAIATDGSGYAYVAGASDANWGTPINNHRPGLYRDAFAAKLDRDANLKWNTFMSFNERDAASAITYDVSGNVYLAGYSGDAGGGPTTTTSFCFATMLNVDGVLLEKILMGSGGLNYCNAITLDLGANVYVAGTSLETWGDPVNPFSSGYEAFAAKPKLRTSNGWNFIIQWYLLDNK